MLVLLLRGGRGTDSVATERRSQNLAGVSDDGLDLSGGQLVVEARHGTAADVDDLELVGDVGIDLDHATVGEFGTARTPAVVAMARGAPGAVDLSALDEDGIGLSVVREWDLGGIGRTACGNQRSDREHDGGHDRNRPPTSGGARTAAIQKGVSHAPDDTHGETAILATVGFDPTRRHQRTRFDVVFVVAGILVAVALVAWALFG